MKVWRDFSKIFAKRYASLDGTELPRLSQGELYALMLIKICVGAGESFGPARDSEIIVLARGQISLRSFQRARAKLAAGGWIWLRRMRSGMVYTLPDREFESAYLKKVKRVEKELGPDAPDCLVQMAAAPISERLKRARYQLAKERQARQESA